MVTLYPLNTAIGVAQAVVEQIQALNASSQDIHISVTTEPQCVYAVSHLGSVCLGDQDIPQLQVSMQDLGIMQVLNSPRDLVTIHQALSKGAGSVILITLHTEENVSQLVTVMLSYTRQWPALYVYGGRMLEAARLTHS